jgi:prepilin-type N-terminal cleavage/methylation domain-containing protein/prepilin-type processing-associated H-X9-DG protein
MATQQKPKGASGLTLIECLVVIAVLVVLLVAVFLPALARSSPKSPRINCVNNLRQVTLGLLMFAYDHDNKLPMEISTNLGGSKEWAGSQAVYRHFLAASNELANPAPLQCPGDKERERVANFANFGPRNLSYWIDLNAEHCRPTNNSSSSTRLLLGDRNLAANDVALSNGCYLVSTQQWLTWNEKTIHQGAGNLGFCDGSVKQASQSQLRAISRRQTIATNWLAIP